MAAVSLPVVAWIIAGAGVFVALVLVGVGTYSVVRVIGPLQTRIDEYGDLPVLRAIDATAQRISSNSALADRFLAAIARANAALVSIQAAGERFRATAALARSTLADARELMRTTVGILARLTRRRRSRGN
jgi:hypothetical protein